MERHAVLITAAGSSTRMGNSVKKEYLFLGNTSVLEQCLRTFESTGLFDWFVITIPPGGVSKARQVLALWLQDPGHHQHTLFVEGASNRQGSVRNGLQALSPYEPSTVLIHDGARPWVNPQTILRVFEGTQKYGACAPVVPLVDSLKRLHPDGTIAEHVDRSAFVGIQTPQGFRFPEIYEAHLLAATDGKEYLDDTEIYHRYIGNVHTVEGDRANRKITYWEDIHMANQAGGGKQRINRIGFGYDLHRLVEQRTLWVGGVAIPSPKGEEGHSDGDVLIHAIIDALLGAISCGDIGSHFPPSDPAYKDISSRILLQKAVSLIQSAGWKVINLDCTVVLETPKLLPYREKICQTLATDLQISPSQISVKGKTKEKQDAVGKQEAIEAYAVALLESVGVPSLNHSFTDQQKE
ncbi:MAG: 2-C-methyl-D-erythritol 2,4-cyclodiphosphate synthase [Spirochaetes bacterium]|nr:2-C-methyl-D-erythritol 2,4-cyclodiphosphate synthase [Spirochaetota bacterium]